ncbi:MAG TPA: DUF1800 family protein [Phycisphaerae bacterium]|nr:DUF1800 family protein [Phycisphaerae bacterium]
MSESAWAPYEPSPRRPWDLARAAHLYRRAGFGATWDELQQALKAGPRRTLDRLLVSAADVAGFNRGFDDIEKAVGSVGPLRAWWLRRMIETPHPLLEKMTLFWHDFFAAGAARVPDASLLRRHVQRLRAGALGDFRTLVAGTARDLAVLLSLGAEANRKARPNEHFARQLLHRYTVGPGACSDSDLRDAARAMTGWFVLRMELRYFQREHDDGEKTVLGKTGKLNAEDVVSLAAGHPATARNVVRRLYRWFVSEADEPDDDLLAPLARSFAEDFDVARLVGTMLRSNLFFSPAAIRRRIKRPVEFAVGIIRPLEARAPTTQLATDLAALGEALYDPPTIDGWQGGRHWINHATLIGRSNLAAALLAASGPYEGRLDPAAVARRHGHADAEAAGRFFADLFLQPDRGGGAFEGLPKDAPPAAGPLDRLRRLAHAVVTQPEFHLA